MCSLFVLFLFIVVIYITDPARVSETWAVMGGERNHIFKYFEEGEASLLHEVTTASFTFFNYEAPFALSLTILLHLAIFVCLS